VEFQLIETLHKNCTRIFAHLVNTICLNQLHGHTVLKLEYLAVYSRASMAAFRQLSTHIVPPRSNVREARLNTQWSKV